MLKKLLFTATLFFVISAFAKTNEVYSIEKTVELEYSFNNELEFVIKPNPSSSTLNIISKSFINEATLEVFDVLGKRIFNKKLNNLNTSVDVSEWKNGIYIVKIQSDSRSITKRFVKN